MYAFKYERPTALADAQKLAHAGGQVLAGGQTMIAAMKQRLQQPETLIDLAAISGLAGIKKDGNNIVIGAMTRHQDVADNAEVQKSIPGLAALANNIGDKQVRAMGTIGGSVANTTPLLAIPVPCWLWAPPSSPTSAPSRPMISSKAFTPQLWTQAKSSLL